MTTIKKQTHKIRKALLLLTGAVFVFVSKIFVPSSETVTTITDDLSDLFSVDTAHADSTGGDGDGGCGAGCGSSSGGGGCDGCCP